MIYFDNAATSFYKPNNVKQEVIKALDLYTANPGRSGHDYSIKTAEKIFNCREKVKNFFKADTFVSELS